MVSAEIIAPVRQWMVTKNQRKKLQVNKITNLFLISVEYFSLFWYNFWR